MTQRIAIIGDIHGCIDELQDLLDLLSAERLDAIYHLGDLVDRGPDSGAVVSLLRNRGIFGVMGNHEAKLLELLRKYRAPALQNEDRRRSAMAVSADPQNIPYLAALPRLHVIDDVLDQPLILVHGGLWPVIPLWQQPVAVMMAQLIDPAKPGAVAWLRDAKAQHQGLVPWWEVWDGAETVVYGHTVWPEPHEHRQTFGIDTGCVYGGHLTALVLPDRRFVKVRARAVYVEKENFAAAR